MRALVIVLLLAAACTPMQRRHLIGATGVATTLGGSFVAADLDGLDGRGTCHATHGVQCPMVWETTGATYAVMTTSVIIGTFSLLYWMDGCISGPNCHH